MQGDIDINETTKATDEIDNTKRPIPPPRTKFSTPTPTLTRRAATVDTARRRPESADVVVARTGIVSGGGADDRNGIGSKRPKVATAAAVADDHGGLPDKHRSLHMPLAPIEGNKLSKKVAADLFGDQVPLPLASLRQIMSDESHDYSEIFTPNADGSGGSFHSQPEVRSACGANNGDGRTGSGDSGLTGLSSTGTAEAAVSAPAPPMHRYPSWEDRIYRVAREGFPHGSGDDFAGNARNSKCGGYGNDIVVPVYASVKGVR